MTPKYPFQVHVTRRVGAEKLHTENHNYETISAAVEYGYIARKKQGVRRVQILVVLDDISTSSGGLPDETT